MRLPAWPTMKSTMSLSADRDLRLPTLAAWWPSIFRPGRNSRLLRISAIYRDGTKTSRRGRARKPDFSWRQSSGRCELRDAPRALDTGWGKRITATALLRRHSFQLMAAFKRQEERRGMDPDAIDRAVRKYAGALGLDRGYSVHPMCAMVHHDGAGERGSTRRCAKSRWPS